MADDPGVVTPSPVAEGAAAYQKLKDGGFSQQEADEWKAQQTQTLMQGGFTPGDVDKYWGTGTPDTTALDAHVNQNFKVFDPQMSLQSRLDAFAAGFNMSVTGLAARGAKPDAYHPAYTDVANVVLQGTGQLVGDLPATIGGLFGGAAAGAAAGATIPVAGETGVPEVIGGIAGGGFGAAALPQAMREIMLDAYNRGEIHTSREFLAMASKSVFNTMKAGVTGAAASVVGGPVAGKVLATTGSRLAAGAAGITATAATATSVSAALDGRLPDAQDFAANAALAVALHVGSKVIPSRGAAPPAAEGGEPVAPGQGFPGGPRSPGPVIDLDDEAQQRAHANLQEIYRLTGTPPWEVTAAAKQNPKIADELLAQDVNGKPVLDEIAKAAPPEAAPFTTAGETAQAEMQGHAFEMMSHEVNDIFRATARPGMFSRMASNIDETHTIPYGGGISDDGQTAYFDKNLPRTITVKRADGTEATMDPRKYIAVHEASEWDGMNRGAKTYEQAHTEDGQRAEKEIVEHDGWDWNDYNTKILAEIAKLSTPEDADNIPKDLFEKPYMQEGQGGLVDRHGPGKQPASAGNVEGREGGALPVPGMAAGGAGGGGRVPPSGGGVAGAGSEALPPPGAKGFKLSEEMLNEKFRDGIGTEEVSNKLLDPGRNYRQWINELGPARAIDKMLAGRNVTPGKDVGIEDMFRQTYASDARLGYFIYKGGLDAVTFNPTGEPPVMDAVKLVKANGGTLADWENYMIAQRKLDKLGQGIDPYPMVTPEDAQRLVELGESKYEEATHSLQKSLNGVLRYAEDSNYLSAAQVEAMRRDNPTYIKMRRMMGEEPRGQGRGRNFRPGAQPKKLEGSDRLVLDPLQNTIDNMGLIIRNADRNRAIGAVLALDDGSLANLGIKRIGYTAQIKATIAEPGSDLFKAYGITNSTPYEPIVANRARRGSLEPNQFLYYRDGKPEVWETSDPDLAQLLRGADSTGEANLLDKAFSGLAAIQRAGIVAAPDFPTRVVLRHQVTAFIADPLHPPPFLTWARGLMDSLGQGDRFWDWAAKGGAGASLTEMDHKYITKNMEDLFKETSVWDSAWNMVKSPLHAAQWVQEKMDAAARIGYTKQAEAKGYTPIKAAIMSRQAYLDYAQKGTLQTMQMISRWTPFLRPHMLGLDQIGGALKERPFETVKYALLAVTLPTVLLYGLNYLQDKYGGLSEDRKFANVPQWQKDNAYVLPEIGGVRVRLAYPFQFGVPFGGLTNRFLDHFSQNDPKAFEGWMRSELNDVMPSVIPPLVLPPLEAETNYNFFTGHPMIPGSLEKASGDMQYTPETTEPAKKLAQALGPRQGLGIANVSPITLENFVRGWGGTLGIDALRALNMPFKVSGRPWELSDIPFVQSFIVRNPGMGAKPIQDYFDEANKFETAHADLQLAIKRAQVGGSLDELASTSADMKAAVQMTEVSKAITMQQAVIQAIYANKEMTATEKRQATDRAYSDMITTAKFGLQIMRSVK